MFLYIVSIAKFLYKRFLIPVLIFSVMLSGCGKSFLDLKNPQAIDFDQIKDLESLTIAATGVYSNFKQANYYNRTFIVIPELMSDNSFISVKNTGKYLNQDRFAVTNGDGYATAAWLLMNKVIANANLYLAAAAKISFPESEKQEANQIIGELYACRALAFFDMVRFFAQPYNYTPDASHLGIPVFTEPADEIIYPARSTVKQTYEQIVSDLQQAASLLKTDRTPGRFNSIAAQALLAKVYLYMEDWKNAVQYATNVIDNSLYSLLPSSSFVASWASKFSNESILEIGNTTNSNSGTDGIGYLTEPGGYGELLATEDLYNTYTGTDIRRQLILKGTRAGGETVAYYIRKYPNGASTKDDNPKVLRMAEMYLIRAEARAELAKTNPAELNGALQDLNAIVKRADPSAEVISLSGDALIDRVLLERRKELAFEGDRLFDLNRKKKNLTNIQSAAQVEFTYPNNMFIMPIPYDEMNANPNMEQNPGWK